MGAEHDRTGEARRVFADYVVQVVLGEGGDFSKLCGDHADLEGELRALHKKWQQEQKSHSSVQETVSDHISRTYGTPGPQVSIEAEEGDSASFTDEVISRLAQHGSSTRYRIKGEVASGGQGAILRVWDTDLRRHLAMKVILDSGESRTGETLEVDPNKLARFLEEAQVTGQLNHPGVVPVYELGIDEDRRVYFTMQLVKGRELGEFFELAREEREDWNIPRALSAILKVCEAVAYAHDKGVIHRDLKPSNVMVGRYGEVYVMDWGLAKVLGKEDIHNLRLAVSPGLTTTDVDTDRDRARESDTDSPLITMDGTVVGTPAYMSPEQARGEVDEMDRRSDVYSIGAILYQLLTGQTPYVPPRAKMSAHTILVAVLSGPPKPVHEIASDVPAELEAICEKAMARAAIDRYADTGGLAEDLRAYLDGRVVRAYETGAWAEARKWVQRNKSLAASLVVAVLLLAGGLGTSLTLKAQSDENARVAERRRDDVLSLSAFQALEDLQREADELWPVRPEDMEKYEAWLRRADELVRGLQPNLAEGDIGHLARLTLLRERALPQTLEEEEADRRGHSRFGEFETLEAKIMALQRAQDVREGRAQPPSFVIDSRNLPMTGMELNNSAWSIIDPNRTAYGDEAHGLALVRLALTRLALERLALEHLAPARFTLARLGIPCFAYKRSRKSNRLLEIGDTLSWALFANGLDDEALAIYEDVLDAVPTGRRAEFEQYAKRLREAVRDSKAVLVRHEAERAALEAKVYERQTWKFENDNDRWWNGQLKKLVAEIRAFADPDEGLVQGLSPDYGWGIARRLVVAEGLRDGFASGGEYASRWEADLPKIRAAYSGLVLPVQVGLVPIGADPDSGLWEFWHIPTGAQPQRSLDGKLEIREDSGLVLVLLPGNSFLMGAQTENGRNQDPDALSDESPVHEVTLSPFFLSKYEMTQGQWKRLVGSNPSGIGPDGDWNVAYSANHDGASLLHPIEQVSWKDCVRQLWRMGLSLPSEAQWEYGARAKSETPWWTGATKASLAGAANLADSYAEQQGAPHWWNCEEELDDRYSFHAPVGRYNGNNFGLHDVHGNVWEWCLDGHLSYEGVRQVDPIASYKNTDTRVIRGGGFQSDASTCRVSKRFSGTPSSAGKDLGLRPARVIDP